MATFVKIASATVGSGGVASVTFSSIPSTYTDLLIFASARSTRAGNTSDGLSMSLVTAGGTISSGYTYKVIQSNNTTIYNSNTGYEQPWGGVIPAASTTASVFSNSWFYIPNYVSSNAKSWGVDSSAENNSTDAWLSFNAQSNTTTSAITGLIFQAGNGNLVQYSTFTLYGISKS